MELHRNEFASVGARLAPLTSLDEAAGFFFAAAANGPHTPSRASTVAQWLGGTLSNAACMLQPMLETLTTMPHVQKILALLPPVVNMALGTERTTCVLCEGALEPAEFCSTAPLFSARGCIKNVQLFKRKCSCCQAEHHLSYASGGLRLGVGDQVPYAGCTDARYFAITKSCVWETSLLVDFEAQALNSHTGFLTFMDEYRMKYDGELPFSDDRARRAFSHAFYSWSLLRWQQELGLPSSMVKLGDASGRDHELSDLDQTLLAQRQQLESAFTRTWGAKHGEHCRNPEKCVCQAIDGHMKARRRVCENSWARLVDCGGLGKHVTNCSRSPIPGSKFCYECRNAAAKRGPAALVGIAGTSDGPQCDECDDDDDLGPLKDGESTPVSGSGDETYTLTRIGSSYICTCPAWTFQKVTPRTCKHLKQLRGEEREKERMEAKPEAGVSPSEHYRQQRELERGWEPSAEEKDVYLIEDILEHKPATIAGTCAPSCSLGPKHRECVRKKKKMYRVKWVGWGEEYNQWVCETDVGQAAIDEYESAREAARARPKKHAGALAAALRAAAGGGTQDWEVTEQDESDFKSVIKCATLKAFQYAEKRRTTAGILALVSGCGLFLKIDEIYGSESLTQVHHFLFQAYHVDGIVKPKVLCYDDACHLKKFLLNRPNSPLCRALLRGMEIVCDRFHFPNHRSAWCKANVDPAKCTVPGFNKANTQAGEEAFSWLAGSKTVFRHMNEARFPFLMLRLAHLRNVQLCKK